MKILLNCNVAKGMNFWQATARAEVAVVAVAETGEAEEVISVSGLCYYVSISVSGYFSVLTLKNLSNCNVA